MFAAKQKIDQNKPSEACIKDVKMLQVAEERASETAPQAADQAGLTMITALPECGPCGSLRRYPSAVHTAARGLFRSERGE